MINNFLCAPLFLTADVPLKETLAQIIKKDFFQPVSAFAEDLNKAQDLHTVLARDSTTASPHLGQYQGLIVDLYHFFSDVSHRFPDNVINFEWFGTLRYDPVEYQVTSWIQEQAHLVYQLGAVLCHRAHNESIYTDDGVKNACVYFKQSAGCFQFLLTQMDKSSELNSELSSTNFDVPTLKTLKLIMLAQAQELVWLKAATSPSRKNSLVARLAKNVAEIYEQALEASIQSKTIILDWTNHMRVKMHHFLAVAFYRMSIVALDTFEYGNQVAYLTAASNQCVEAINNKKYVKNDVIEDLKGLTELVASILRTAQKENDLVFLKPVPSFQSLPAIDSICMVELEPPVELATERTKHAFATLVPFSIIQIAQAFKEREEAYIQQTITEPLLALTRMLHQFLADRDLPATIDTIQKPESIPDSIAHHLKEMISIGGVNIIENTMSQISELALKSRNLIFECEERLRMESYEDDILRERGGSLWTRPPSADVSGPLNTKLEKMKSYIQQGHQSDVLIGESYELIKPALQVYCGGKETLQRKIPNSLYIKLDPETGKLVNHIKELISETNKLEASRQRFVSSVNSKPRKCSVLPLVLSEYKRNPAHYQQPSGAIDPVKFETIYEKHILNYKEDVLYVEALKQKQKQFEAQLDESNVQLSKSKEILNNAAQQERLKALQYFEKAYVQYLELIENLNRASGFYTDFLEKGNGVLRELEEFLYSRREEARELTIQIQNQMNFNHIESSMSLPRLAAPRGVRLNSMNKLSENSKH